MGASNGKPVRIILPDGKVETYPMELTVEEFQNDFPGYSITASAKVFRDSKGTCLEDKVMHGGKTYFARKLKVKSSAEVAESPMDLEEFMSAYPEPSPFSTSKASEPRRTLFVPSPSRASMSLVNRSPYGRSQKSKEDASKSPIRVSPSDGGKHCKAPAVPVRRAFSEKLPRIPSPSDDAHLSARNASGCMHSPKGSLDFSQFVPFSPPRSVSSVSDVSSAASSGQIASRIFVDGHSTLQR
eukprot:TRINITY_DN10538_c0_g1_i1.p1 TRINITY_DN10538_c0_g1~~TRINITY_DN10538_c0_g1_i1.p1  ORF type:complete len:241 (-),score=33.77 TRINITY_DN10538_c0_g1_i1:2107-2829(-)